MREEDSVSCCALMCGEDASELAGELADDSEGYFGGDTEFPDDSDESIAGFIETEADFSPGSDYPDRFRSKSLDPFARQDAIDWILKVHAYYHFRPLTAYLAVNYLDRFLSSHSLPQYGWALQLLSVACLSLAAKMEETLVPSLLDLQVEGAKFIFESRTVARMEILVLSALNWRLRAVTPFTFITYFAYKIDPSGKHSRCLVLNATQIILSTMHDIDFICYCPSALAASAMICATNEVQDLASADPVTALSWCVGLTKEVIVDCYRMMQRFAMDETARLSRRCFSPMKMSSTISSSSSPPTKRRKLGDGCLSVEDDHDKKSL